MTGVPLCTLLALLASAAVAPAEPQRFASPEAAVDALAAALEARDRAAVLAIFGPENDDVASTGDAQEDRALWGGFLENLREIRRIERQEGRAILYAGREMWPFPAPLVRADGSWRFDAGAAREEVLARRIGRNELDVIDIMRRAGEVQATYRRIDHDGDGVMEFAASLLSSPGARDGLYWSDAPGTEPSPFDETLARASLTGYREGEEDRAAEPHDGYYFHILQEQGQDAPGGAYSYMIAGNMVAGHALVACPAIYGETGIMSFLVGEEGVVYEADLGEDTLSKATEIVMFDPGDGWRPVE